MANKIQVCDTVYVPCSRLSQLPDIGVALYRTTVVSTQKRSAKVVLPGDTESDWIGTALLHRDVGILVINIGDFASESTLLDPLAKSVAQFCRLLVEDGQLRQVRVRSLLELKRFWLSEQAAYSHVIFVGHGSAHGLKFAVDGIVSAEDLMRELETPGAPKKILVSLCCKTGYRSFGSVVSKARICNHFIGPFHSVEGAIASQFVQTFLVSHLLNGVAAGVAFNHARNAVPGSSSFRLWNAGKLKAGPK